MYKNLIKSTLKKLSEKKISVGHAYDSLKDFPYKDLGFAKIDNHRALRRGFPEVVYCAGKTQAQVLGIVRDMMKRDGPILLTRASPECFKNLSGHYSGLKYSEEARAVYRKDQRKNEKKGIVTILTAGTSDIPVAEEAKITLEVMGNRVKTLYDVGVAGIHRLLDKKDLLRKSEVIIVVAGMEGALASVVSGLVSKPVIAVPTSVGYGASFKGLSALLTMMDCCSPGVSVVNIDNGFGAGYFASLINK